MKGESGNALFIILIAVALFAALSYAVTSSGRGGSGIDKEQASLAASQILQYASTLQTAVQRLMIIGRCGESEISFENPDAPVSMVNPRAPGDQSCHMFSSSGAGLEVYPVKPEWLVDPSAYSANSYINWHGHAGGFFGTRNVVGTPTIAAEMVWVLPWLADEICDEINRRLGIVGSTSYGYWMSMPLGPYNFRNNDSTNQKPYRASCSTGNVGDSRPMNTFHYTLLER